jgi:hypothetical protein
LPINTTAASAADAIKKKLQSKNWQEYELKPIKLNLMPYFLFNYHYFIEEEISGKKTVKRTVTGILAIDGHEVKVREDLVELLKHNWKKSTSEMPRGEFKEKYNNIDKREQDEVLQMKTAEYFGIPKPNVVVSSPKKLLLPLYKTSVIVAGKEYPIIINAIDGSISGLKEVPEREKGYIEITKETIRELKKPSSWLRYSKEAILESFHGVEKSVSGEGAKKTDKKDSVGIDLSFLNSKIVLLIIMLLGIILIIMGIFRIKPI